MKLSTRIDIEASRLPADGDRRLTPFIASCLKVSVDDVVGYAIVKRSVDARRRGHVMLQYALTVELRDGARPSGTFSESLKREEWNHPEKTLLREPVIVGAGPAGLFAALVLAEAGACPIVLERGRDVESRRRDINAFLNTRRLDVESNYLYGDGGAGTWSDGKLFTRVHDVRSDYVLRCFVEAGAPPEIMYFAHPHIGSDLLPGVIASIRQRIIKVGGSFLWNTKVVGIEGEGRFRALKLGNGTRIEAPAALVACGHSARELILDMTRHLSFTMKPFQMGCRIEHPQRFINSIRYGRADSFPVLGAAEYLFSCRGYGEVPGATTFCMCPGGQIIPATCEEYTLATNGMSNSKRDGRLANSAIISTLPADMFQSPQEAFAFIGKIERNVFERGGRDYTAPAQCAVDFLERRASRKLFEGSYPLGLCPGRLDILAAPVYKALANAIRVFERQTPGFAVHGMLTGVETRVSSPVRFSRNETGASSLPGLFLAGEGAGMAGGIMSAAIDGIRMAEAMMLGCQGR